MSFVLRSVCVAIAIIGALGFVSNCADMSPAVAWGAVTLMAVIGLGFTDIMDRKRVRVEEGLRLIETHRGAVKGLAASLVALSADVSAAAAEAAELAEAVS